MNKKRKISIFDQLLIGGLSLILSGFLAYWGYVQALIEPFSSARAQALTIAKQKTDLKNAQTFDIVTTDETYYSLTGTNAKGQDIAVLIPKSSHTITEIALSDGVSAASLPKEGSVKVELALFKGKPVWEVNTSAGFKIYDFKTGKALL
jgi:uncharacterized protein YpmB